MSDATANPSTPAQTTPASDAPAGAKPAPGTPALIEHYIKIAAKARLADDKAALDGLAAAKAGDEPAEVTESAEGRERGKDGKFKPKPGKPAKLAAEAKPAEKQTTEAPIEEAPTEEPAQESPHIGAGLGNARKLVREGNIAKALELIGLHPEKLEGKQWGAFRQREKEAVEAERRASAKEQQLAHVARQLHEQYSRFEQARKAYEAEDYDGAFKLAFNEDANDYQRKRVAAMTTKDPKVAQLERELREFKAQRAQEEQRRQDQHAEAERAQAQQSYKSKLSEELGDMDDGRFARVAKRPAFIQKVFDIQKQHWNDRTGETIDTIEAAELAWEELYEGVAGEPSTTAASPASKPAGTATTPVRQAAKSATTLNQREAAEAAPAPKLAPGSPELRDYYARKAQLALNGEASG